ncbi:MAG: hypothetical protein A2172_03665 [Candidatus Woykebacteria bacterium RBG_13_40_15]|uniref:Membrane protein 6-pyruvoyl-tetrahydropterin synthase-related domain-containing protein n=1 Tax=Candidatus Woykebacteria bacterium RBG_13_40_15 TaxID=1802593 RepID=A0A1G1WAF6_9BACT|nr:MAG: hypothetical protein A2172_03665 [Candidatus Woykebacteria bacterium RBG_13_40_15]
MKLKKYLIILILISISFVNSFVFYSYFGRHVKQSETQYSMIYPDPDKFGAPDYYYHQRYIYETSKNLKLGRLKSLSITDELMPINSFPLFQYYNAGPLTVLGLINIALDNPVLVYTLGIWLFTFIFVVGVYSFSKSISKSESTSLVTAFIFVTFPYYLTNLLSRSAFTEYLAISLLPIILFLIYKFLTIIKSKNLSLASYLIISSLLIVFSTIFLLSHNLTVLFSILLLTLPFIFLLIKYLPLNLTQILLFIGPFFLIGSNVLFYWIPVISSRDNISLSSSFNPEFVSYYTFVSTPDIVLSLLPKSSQGSTTPELYLQIGLPVILLLILFFQRKRIYIYLLLSFIFILLFYKEIWSVLPKVLTTIQFSYRLLSYIPILLLFSVKKLNKYLIILLIPISIISATIFYQRDLSIYQTKDVFFDSILTQSNNDYYKNENFNTDLKMSVENLQNKTILEIPNYNGKELKIDTIEKDNSIKATSYLIKIETDSTLNDKVTINSTFSFKNRSTSTTSTIVSVPNKFFLFSTCLNNVKKFDISIQNKDPKVVKLNKIEVKKVEDKSNMYLDQEQKYFKVVCDYSFDSESNSFTFNIDKPEKQHILPIFYSSYNKLTTDKGEEINNFGSYLHKNKSYTVVNENGINYSSVSVKLLEKNKWFYVSKLSVILSLIVIITSIVFYFFSIFKPVLLKLVDNLNLK